MVSELWDGKRPLTDSNILRIVGSLFESQVLAGFGKGFNEVDFETPDGVALTRLTRDVWQFSAAKNYQQMRDMTLALRDADGNLREFSDFKQACADINAKFNNTWLRTEYDTAIASAQMSSKWQEFLKNEKEMPFLRYSTVGDERVRTEHALLDGIIRRITDAFWRTHYPPNGWKCRCDVDQLATSSAKETENLPNVPINPLFKTNLAQSGLIFPKGHPYYDGVPVDEIRRSIAYLPKDAPFKDIYTSESGGSVKMHLLHGYEEMSDNVRTAKVLADKGFKVKLLPVLNEKDDDLRELIYGSNDFVKGKNPDTLVNKRIADIKHPASSKNAIHNAIRHGAKQSDFIIIHLKEEMGIKELNRYVLGKLKQSKAKEVWVLNGDELIQFQSL